MQPVSPKRLIASLAAVLAAAFAVAACAAESGADAPATAGCAPSDGLRFICGPVASEDLARVPGTRWLIASGMNIGQPAHLYLIDARGKTAGVLFPLGEPQMALDRRIAPGCSGPPDLSRMSTDGLGLRPGPHGVHMLYAANHGDRRAIEMFRLDARGARPRLRWVGCAAMPPGTLPNAVAPLPDGGLLVSSFYDPTDPTAWARMARGEDTGRILEWRPGTGFRPLPGGVMSGANGLETSADGSLVYASAWSGRRLVILSLRDGTRREIALDFLPDNIHRLPDGSLLVGGQRARVEDVAACAGPQCPQAWELARVDPRTGAVRPLLKREGTSLVNYGCGGLALDGAVFITARGDRRIVYVPQAELPPLR